MEIHNLMEELVRATVEEICSEDQAGTQRYCTAPQCRTDAVCYVLNRVPPRYVSSGRGLAHLTADLQKDQQLMVDVVKLTHEALGRVSAVRRAYYDQTATSRGAGACFNFPTIKGRILDGAAFMPVSDIDVELRLGGKPVEMFDERWTNPYRISDRTPGTFIFWPAPADADAAGVSQTFDFELVASAKGYYDLSHHFSVELQSDDGANQVVDLIFSLLNV